MLGICGTKNSGKDTAYQFLSEILPVETVQISFAEPLKRAALELLGPLGVTEEDVFGPSKLRERSIPELSLEKNITLRYFLQELGTEFGRDKICKDIWVILGMAQADLAVREGKFPIITDVRFLNEAQAIKNRRGVIWRLARHTGGSGDTHPSERELQSSAFLPYIDLWVRNQGTKEEFRELVKKASSTLPM